MPSDKVTKPKPSVLELKADNIPAELKALPQWVCWKLVWNSKRKEWTKPPYNPKYRDKKAKTNDPKTWSEFDAATKNYKANGFDGIGFVLCDKDPFTGWDADDCVDPDTGDLLPWAKTWMAKLNSYSEISPSGTGIRIFVKANKPDGLCRYGKKEIYQNGRFLTVTGHRVLGSQSNIEERQAETNELHAALVAEKKKNTKPKVPKKRTAKKKAAVLDDQKLLETAFGATNGDRIERLGFFLIGFLAVLICHGRSIWKQDHD